MFKFFIRTIVRHVCCHSMGRVGKKSFMVEMS